MRMDKRELPNWPVSICPDGTKRKEEAASTGMCLRVAVLGDKSSLLTALSVIGPDPAPTWWPSVFFFFFSNLSFVGSGALF